MVAESIDKKEVEGQEALKASNNGGVTSSNNKNKEENSQQRNDWHDSTILQNHNHGRSALISTDDTVVKQDATLESTSRSSLFALAMVVLITCVTYPPAIVDEVSIHHVWYYGWITAVSTGLGVVPLVFVPDLDKFWVGVSNSIAAGMMTAASYSLFFEGCTYSEPRDTSDISSTTRTAFGGILGLAFILLTKSYLDTHEDLKVGSLVGADAKKVLLIVFVMTLHSFAEGVGIGVSFGGDHGKSLGLFISASLAVHNVPEGLAVAIVLLPRKVSKTTAALWCITTSLPQPLMAVPTYLFINEFIPFLPVGLGFAAGAMAWVAFFELLIEAYEDTNLTVTSCVSVVSLCGMLWLQGCLSRFE